MNPRQRSRRLPDVASGDYLGVVGIVAAVLAAYLARSLLFGAALLAFTAAGALAFTPYRRRVHRAWMWAAVFLVAAMLFALAATGGIGGLFQQASRTYRETSGGLIPTWTDYTNGGGTQGPSIPAYTTIDIACSIMGLHVKNGNPWWYRIAQHPWAGRFYSSADGFYNNGATAGSLRHTPFVDRKVPVCRQP